MPGLSLTGASTNLGLLSSGSNENPEKEINNLLWKHTTLGDRLKGSSPAMQMVAREKVLASQDFLIPDLKALGT